MRLYWNVCFFITGFVFGHGLTPHFCKFIEGILTNLGAQPLDRIQTMLRYVPDYDQSIDQLATFMEAARREGLVIGRDGTWKLNK